ncbi:acyltransferase GLAUCE [Cornus florida]|uniref:acyltransferase GLAUCE n=1 Tax=Cornus florida TaxID=4283 RepID=UPI0028A10084|nr:acyltransferase GLAUCE [Cornus florida]
MGSLPVIEDLKVTLHDTSLVFPFQENERKSMFLSNIDQVLNFNVQTVHFFPAHPDFPSEILAEKVRTAFCKVLVPYDFLAGRLKLNPELGRFEIDCNGAGAGFVVASSEFTLHEIGDLVYPNPGFRQLIIQSMDKLGPNDQPLCIVQVTSFKCGGFAIGISTNHATFDGLSFKIFLQNLASQASDKPLLVIPCNDRRLLAARSPPRVTFPHPELLKLKLPGQETPNPTVFDCPKEDLDFKILRLSSGDLSSLKEKAKTGAMNAGKTIKITGFNAVTAHIWRCKALSCASTTEEEALERSSTVLYAVDIRPRLRPPLPPSYTGNAVLTAYATAKCRELEEGPFWRLVEMVGEGAGRMTDEYARSAIDWGEVYKGFPHGEFLISSWWRLGFAEVEYPWGKPRYSCPVVCHRKDIILLFPDIEGVDNDGVNVLVALPAKEMVKFQTLFHKLLP